MRNDEAVNVKIASNGEDIVDNGVDIVSVVSSDSQGGTDDEAAVSREDSDVDDDDWEYEDAIGTDDDEEEEEETSGAGELSDDEMSKSTISLPLRDPSEVGEGESDDESDDETWDYETDTSETDDDNEEEDLTLPAIIHELSVDDTLQAPAWRMVDQHESLSDCTVHVDKVDGTRHQTYHVHTYALAFGACRSEYFATLFRSQQFQEHASRTSNILLHDAAAHAFPDFLDFLYGGTIEVKERPVALYHLADFFRVRALMEVIEETVLQRISVHSNVESACRFYREALTFDPPVQAFIDCIEQV